MHTILKPSTTQLNTIIGASRPILPNSRWRRVHEVEDVAGAVRDGLAIQAVEEYGLVEFWPDDTRYLGMVSRWGTSTEIAESENLEEMVDWFAQRRQDCE